MNNPTTSTNFRNSGVLGVARMFEAHKVFVRFESVPLNEV